MSEEIRPMRYNLHVTGLHNKFGAKKQSAVSFKRFWNGHVIIEYILKIKMQMSWTYSKNERQQMDQALRRVATKQKEKIKRTSKQRMAG